MTELDIIHPILSSSHAKCAPPFVWQVDPDADTTVQVHYSTLNYKDGLVLCGKPGVARAWPIVPGIDFAGTVVSTAASSPFEVGDEVVLTGACTPDKD